VSPNIPIRSRGFTLIEVLVAVVVICVGMLGIAKMQALALSNTTTSRMRALASLEAASLAAAMHSNRLYWSAAAPASVTVVPTAIASTDANMAAQAGVDLGNLPACVGTLAGGVQCTPSNLAAYDLANWATDLGALLPNPSATILCPPAVNGPVSCTIQITWTEHAVRVNAQAIVTGQFATPTYTLYVEP